MTNKKSIAPAVHAAAQNEAAAVEDMPAREVGLQLRAPVNPDHIEYEAYDNEADNFASCVCTLTLKDGSNVTGVAPRTDDLLLDQAAARALALA